MKYTYSYNVINIITAEYDKESVNFTVWQS